MNKTCSNKSIVKNINIMINIKKLLTTVLLCIFIFAFYISEAKANNFNNSEIKTNKFQNSYQIIMKYYFIQIIKIIK